MALVGPDTYRKHYFCDWVLGFAETTGAEVRIEAGGQILESPADRSRAAAMLGRSPLLYGETIQESLLYRTQGVRKQDLYALVERLYGPGLRARTSPETPLLDRGGRPVPTQTLTAREHLEIAQINALLQRTPLLVLDLSSELMAEAMAEGFRPCPELVLGAKTVLAILPPNADLFWGEAALGGSFSSALTFA